MRLTRKTCYACTFIMPNVARSSVWLPCDEATTCQEGSHKSPWTCHFLYDWWFLLSAHKTVLLAAESDFRKKQFSSKLFRHSPQREEGRGWGAAQDSFTVDALVGQEGGQELVPQQNWQVCHRVLRVTQTKNVLVRQILGPKICLTTRKIYIRKYLKHLI